MTRKRKILLALAAGAVLLAGYQIYEKKKLQEVQPIPEFVFTYAENQAADYPTTLGAYQFAKLVNERTDGKIEIRIYPDAEMGDENSVMEQMEFGGIDFTRVSASALADDIPKLNVLMLPYLYRDSAHMWSVLEGEIGAEFFRAFDETNLVPLSWYDAGARNFYSTKAPIEKPSDLKGLKIRVQNTSLLIDVMTTLGATPVPLAFDQVYSALEIGSIDGAENNWPSFESTSHYEVAKYYTVDEHIRIPELQLVSQVTWDKLPEQYQAIIQECARESSVYERRLWKERERSSESKIRSAGCEITELTPGEKRAFQEAMQPVYEKYGAEDSELIQAIIDAGEEDKSGSGRENRWN